MPDEPATKPADPTPALRRRYAQLFLEVGKIQAIAEEAGVDRSLVEWTGSPVAIWSSLFAVAGRNNQVPVLIETVERASREELAHSRGGGASRLLRRDNLPFTLALAGLALLVVLAFVACALREAIDPGESAVVAMVYLALAAASAVATWFAFTASDGRASLALATMRLLTSRPLRGVVLVAHVGLALALGILAHQRVRVRFDCRAPERGVRCAGVGSVCGETRWVRRGARVVCGADGYDPAPVTPSAADGTVEVRLTPRMLWQCRLRAPPSRRTGGPPGVAADPRFLGYWEWTLDVSGPAEGSATLGIVLTAPDSGGPRVAAGRFEVPSRPASVRRACQSREGTSLELPLTAACRDGDRRTLSLSVYDEETAPVAAPSLSRVAVFKISGDSHASGSIECR